MPVFYILTGLALLLLARLGHSQQLPNTTAHVVALPDVAVHAHTRLRILSPPGETRGLHTAFGRELSPTSRVAVWPGPPDTIRLYVVRAVRLRLGSRIPESFADSSRRRRAAR